MSEQSPPASIRTGGAPHGAAAEIVDEAHSTPVNPAGRGRIEIVDIARCLALFAMVIYHFTWDLEHFSYVEHGLTGTGGWRLFARCIASSFLFLVGVGLVLAHGRAIRWKPFLVRLGQVAAGAVAVTIATFFATPNSFVYFGILQHIVVASLLGLLFLRLPWWLTAFAAAIVFVAPQYLSSPVFDPKWLDWIGFFATPPVSNDFVPLFPFFAATLAGIATAKLAVGRRWFGALRGLNDRVRLLWPLGVLGRHTLLFYLLHQPILFGLVFLASIVAPPDLHAVLNSDCQRACAADRDPAFCQRYCDCVEGELDAQNLFDALMGGDPTEAEMTRIRSITNECSFRSEDLQTTPSD